MARNNLINESRNKYFSNNRNNLIMSERYFVPNNSCFNFNIQKKRKRIPNSKSFTDYWSCRYDMEKENDRVYFLQKQNISHMKNLIDETLRLRKKSKFPQHDIYAAVQEEKNLNKKKILQRKDQAIKEKEKMNQIFDQISKKQKEDEFNKECKLHREIENMKEKSQTKFQKDLLMRQRLWEKQHFEHQKKVEQMHKKKHEMAVEEYMQILKKGIERYEKIDERKNELSMKYQRKNEERNIYLINYKIKNRIIEKNLREKFERKHRNISKFYFIQKDVIYKQRKEREYNNFINYNNRLLNKSMENNRRKRLLDLFEKNEDKSITYTFSGVITTRSGRWTLPSGPMTGTSFSTPSPPSGNQPLPAAAIAEDRISLISEAWAPSMAPDLNESATAASRSPADLTLDIMS